MDHPIRSRMEVESFKCPPELIARVDAVLVRFVQTRRQAPISRGEFIRLAISEKLDHLKRSSCPGRRRRKGVCGWVGNTEAAGNALWMRGGRR